MQVLIAATPWPNGLKRRPPGEGRVCAGWDCRVPRCSRRMRAGCEVGVMGTRPNSLKIGMVPLGQLLGQYSPPSWLQARNIHKKVHAKFGGDLNRLQSSNPTLSVMNT